MTNEEISLRTKQELAAALKRAMERKPLSKVTVRELIEECHVNRKTFYYHFQNTYDLLKWMLEQEAIMVVKNYDLVENTEGAIRFVACYVEENRQMINSAYDSMGHEEIKRFLYKDLFEVMNSAVKQGEKELGICVEKEFEILLTKFYTEASAGILLDWVKNKSSQGREELLKNILLIFKASLPQLLLAGKERSEL